MTVIPLGRALLRGSSDLPEGWTHRAGTCPAIADSGTPFLFGLAPCGVCPARAITGAAVRSYRTFSPLPRRSRQVPETVGAPRLAAFARRGIPESHQNGEAVCFLWHFPSSGLESTLPDVIRHTALRSSDFPLPHLTTRQRPSGPAAYLFIICDSSFVEALV